MISIIVATDNKFGFGKDEMVEELSNIYEVDRIQIEKDLINFAKLLEEKGLITID
jgi:hypothetical protein